MPGAFRLRRRQPRGKTLKSRSRKLSEDAPASEYSKPASPARCPPVRLGRCCRNVARAGTTIRRPGTKPLRKRKRCRLSPKDYESRKTARHCPTPRQTISRSAWCRKTDPSGESRYGLKSSHPCECATQYHHPQTGNTPPHAESRRE